MRVRVPVAGALVVGRQRQRLVGQGAGTLGLAQRLGAGAHRQQHVQVVGPQRVHRLECGQRLGVLALPVQLLAQHVAKDDVVGLARAQVLQPGDRLRVLARVGRDLGGAPQHLIFFRRLSDRLPRALQRQRVLAQCAQAHRRFGQRHMPAGAEGHRLFGRSGGARRVAGLVAQAHGQQKHTRVLRALALRLVQRLRCLLRLSLRQQGADALQFLGEGIVGNGLAHVVGGARCGLRARIGQKPTIIRYRPGAAFSAAAAATWRRHS